MNPKLLCYRAHGAAFLIQRKDTLTQFWVGAAMKSHVLTVRYNLKISQSVVCPVAILVVGMLTLF